MAYVAVPSAEMSTHCGWRYGLSVYERRAFTPDTRKKEERCPRCFDLVDTRNEVG